MAAQLQVRLMCLYLSDAERGLLLPQYRGSVASDQTRDLEPRPEAGATGIQLEHVSCLAHLTLDVY